MGQIAPCLITPIAPEDLQAVWPFVRGEKRPIPTGLERLILKVKPDFVQEDVFSAIKSGWAKLFIVTRGGRRLGWFVNYIQRRPFSQTPELFLWCAYTIPIRERLMDDDIDDALRQSLEFMHEQKRQANADRIVMMSTRKGFQRFGFKESFTTWYLP